jgi:hypothetical protein
MTPTPTPTVEPKPQGPFRPVASADVDFIGYAWEMRPHVTSNGKMLLYTDEAIAILSDSTWEIYLSDLPGFLIGFDEKDKVWAVNEDGGEVFVWDGLSWKSYGADEGWSSFEGENWWGRPVQRGIHTDRLGQIWVGTFEDVRVFNGEQWMIYSLEDMGMSPREYEEANYDFTFTFLKEGAELWVGACDTAPIGPSTRGGVSWFDGYRWYGAETSIPQGCAGSIKEDVSGRVWVGINGDIWLYESDSGTWRSFTPPAPLPPLDILWYGRVMSITLDPSDNPWVTFLLCGGAGCEGMMLLQHLRDGAWTQITESSFQMEGLQQLILDGEGTAWLFWNGTIFEMKGNEPVSVALLTARRATLDASGQMWFIAWHEGRDWLWTLDTE